MNMPSLEEQTEAFKMWKNCEAVEEWSEKVGWVRLEPTAVLYPSTILRRRPQPKLRPWKPEEVPIGAWVRLSSVPAGWIGMIVSVNSEHFRVMAETCWGVPFTNHGSYEHSTDAGKTWSACGVVE